jgi:hypothetical protein
VYSGFEAPVFTSTNSGTTWATNDTPIGPWEAVACSADGHRLAAAMWGGPVCTSQSMPASVLRASLSSNQLVIAWTIPSLSFALHQTSDLSANTWTEVTNKPAVDYTSLMNQLALPPEGNRFYRLIAR